MSAPSSILVVAATARELAPADGWRILECGVGPVDAAARTAAAIAAVRPTAVLHVGIAGARRAAALAPATVVIGSEARYCDLGVGPEWAPSSVPAHAALLAAAQRVLPRAAVMPIGTSAWIGGTLDRSSTRVVEAAVVEAMEGFAVLRAAQLAGVPALEVRSISNDIEEADRARWHFAAAFGAITAATPALVHAIAAALAE
jgi:nucleoside phosphorylase